MTRARLRSFQQRVPRFRRIRAAGISTARLLRTGGVAAMTYGQAVMGVAPSVLLQQRRAAAAAAAPAGGTCGQSLDLALLVADETCSGKADLTLLMLLMLAPLANGPKQCGSVGCHCTLCSASVALRRRGLLEPPGLECGAWPWGCRCSDR